MISELQTVTSIETNTPFLPFSLDFSSAQLTDEQFERLCRDNPDLKFEFSAEGELIIVPPTSPESGWKSSDLVTEVNLWSRQDKTGIVFDSSTMFTFPNGAKRSPDVSWMTLEKWNTVSEREKRKFSKVVPDFVIELRSPTDNLADLQDKMGEYIENGVRLGWLIDPLEHKVYIYRADGEIEISENSETLSGENVLPNFQLNVSKIL